MRSSIWQTNLIRCIPMFFLYGSICGERRRRDEYEKQNPTGMKKLFTFFLLLMGIGAVAQPFGNEWIDYSKTYYKFKIGSNGLVRIPQSTLAAAGLGGVPAEQFQLFRNGQEVPIYV